MGEEGPPGGGDRTEAKPIDADRVGSVNEESGDGERDTPRDGARDFGCWRIRRRPETPRPCSCSATMGDKTVGLNSEAF